MESKHNPFKKCQITFLINSTTPVFVKHWSWVKATWEKNTWIRHYSLDKWLDMKKGWNTSSMKQPCNKSRCWAAVSHFGNWACFFLCSSSHSSFDRGLFKGQYLSPRDWLCPVSAVITNPQLRQSCARCCCFGFSLPFTPIYGSSGSSSWWIHLRRRPCNGLKKKKTVIYIYYEQGRQLPPHLVPQ